MRVVVKNGFKTLDSEGVVHMVGSGSSDMGTMCGFASGVEGVRTNRAVTCKGCIGEIKHVLNHAQLKTASAGGLRRYRVRVVFPPHEHHKGFVVWAADEKSARNKVRSKGHVIRHVKREEVPA